MAVSYTHLHKSAYLCNVFFIVLDLRLTKVGARRCSFFYVYTSHKDVYKRQTVDGPLKAVFFLLFLFAVGYKVGPQFFRGLKKDGLPQVGFAVLMCLSLIHI